MCQHVHLFLPSAIIFLAPKLAGDLELTPALPVLTAQPSACRAWGVRLCCPTNGTPNTDSDTIAWNFSVPLMGTQGFWTEGALCNSMQESGPDFKTLNDQDIFFITEKCITLLCTWKFMWSFDVFYMELSVVWLSRNLVFCLSG